MNIIEKTFCRTYQFGFKAAMPILPYHEPKIYHFIENVTDILKAENKNCALIVTDPGIKQSGIIDTLTKILKQANIKFALYDQTRANPTIYNIEEGLKIYKENNCDSLIAIGGGSSMDCAKAIGARVVYPKKSVQQMKGLMHVLKKIPTLITVPTTAGTGSEVTVTAVITDPDKKHKYTLNNFTFIPYYAILDPRLTVTLPPSLTATTGMDALTHAVEGYITKAHNVMSDMFHMKAIKMIFEFLPRAVNDKDEYAIEQMGMAQYIAGMGFSNVGLGIVHSMAHQLGAVYDTPHGIANAMLLPTVMRFNGEDPATAQRFREILCEIGRPDARDLNDQDVINTFVWMLSELSKAVGITQTIKDYGAKEEDFEMLADKAMEDPCKPGNPRDVSKEEFIELFRRAM